jgi:sulfhydrogenase subunit beta (sulfur reductase)
MTSPIAPSLPGSDTQMVVERADMSALLQVLKARGYDVIGPTVRDGSVVYDHLESVEDLPVGWTDEQDAGAYHLKRRGDQALFGFTIGPQAWKRYLYPPKAQLMRARQENGTITFRREDSTSTKKAFVGVRSCEVHAIAIQDRVFLEGPYRDPIYAGCRDGLFIVAVNCGQAGGTCFCASMGTGPRTQAGFDVALTEVLQDGRHYFVTEAGSEQGSAVLQDVPHRLATSDEQQAASAVMARTAESMGRTMPTEGLKDLLYANHDHPRWDDVAGRCLSCGNCTMVCPTCFCSSVEDVTNLTGDEADRDRVWTSCFSIFYSYIHGGSVRRSPKSRYRQWVTHKLATWVDQFGVTGCVGCGRCITWCPVGIDITEEVKAIGQSAGLHATHA